MRNQNKEQQQTQQYFSTREAAQYLGVSEGYLEQSRMRGIGPAYIKLGARKKSAVRYRLTDLEKFAEKSLVDPSATRS